ncbi:MAG TPA: hypothetical protein VHY83_13755 [Solirubrobacteraceae bacterium]|nr:hypothetical protein [Solirubrobacteraceae bacterium]
MRTAGLTLAVLAGTVEVCEASTGTRIGRVGSPSSLTGPPTRLHAAFIPKRLGAASSISFTVNIDPPALGEPPPLSAIDFSYPSGLGFATSGLGLASCDPARLEGEGAAACPANSMMGAGHAVVQVVFGPDIVQEQVSLALFAGPSADGYLHLLILASGGEPVEARIVMAGVLLPGHLQITVPPVPGLPGAPAVALTQIQATLGGALTYHERVRGRLISYRPKGIGLPASCPRGGWRLGATLAFMGGGQSHAQDVIACPARRRPARGA